MEGYVSLSINVTLSDPSGSPLAITNSSESGSSYTGSTMISSIERNQSGVYTCRIMYVSASTFLSNSDAYSVSVKIAVGKHGN